MRSLLISLILTVALARTGTNLCSNKLFTKSIFQKEGLTLPTFQSVPALQQSSQFCENHAGQLSCCSDQSLEQLAAEHQKYEGIVNKFFDDVVEKAISKCDYLDKFSGADSHKFEEERQNVLTALDVAIDECKSSILTYTRGMLCFGCNPNANTFFDRNDFFINEDDFNTLKASCSQFIDSHKSFVYMSALHEAKLSKKCNRTPLPLSQDANSDKISLCLVNVEEAFPLYLRKAAEAFQRKFAWKYASLKTSYANGQISFCDVDGCEVSNIPKEVLSAFAGVSAKKYDDLLNLTPQRNAIPTRKCAFKGKDENGDRCSESIVRDAVRGVFVDLHSFFNMKNVASPVIFSDEGGFTPMKSVRAKVAIEPSAVELIRAQLSNSSSNNVPNYFKNALSLTASLLALFSLTLI